MKEITKLLLISIFAIGLTAGCGNSKKEESKKTENKQEVTETEPTVQEQMPSMFSFEEKNIEYKDGETRFTLVITNNTETEQNISSIKMTFFNNDGGQEYMTKKNIKTSIKAKESKQVKITINRDVSKIDNIAYDFYQQKSNGVK